MAERQKKRRRYARPSLIGFLTGRVTLSGDTRDAARTVDACMRFGISYSVLVYSAEEGRFLLTASLLRAMKLLAVCRAAGIALRTERRSGLPILLVELCRRPGLILGAVLALLLLTLGGSVLWEIRVSGNETIPRSEVLAALSEAGLDVGDRLEGLDVDAIENRLLLSDARISWITVNLIGNIAEVQIRERLDPEMAETDRDPANLVASTDGVIVGCEILSGNLSVKIGDAVQKGELLVSGLYDSQNMGYRYTRARGKIYAETRHTFTVTIPLSDTRERTVRTAGKTYRLLFFGETVELFSTGETDCPSTYETRSYLRLFGVNLPIGLSTLTALETETEEIVRGENAAIALAYYRLSEEIAALPDMQGLLEKRITSSLSDTEYRLVCEIRCIENIAETREIELGIFTEGED